MRKYFLGVILYLSAFNASAAIIYDNGLPNPDIPLSGVTSDVSWPRAWVDNFSLAPDSNQVEKITWWGTTSSGNIDTTDAFIISIYADNGSGSPVKTDHDVITPIGNITKELIENKYFEYTATIAPTLFTANQTYWLGIQNNSPDHPYWIWKTSSDIGEAHTREGSSYDWELYYNNTYDINLSLAFQLEGPNPVPVPSAIWLFGSGLLGLIGFARRKKT